MSHRSLWVGFLASLAYLITCAAIADLRRPFMLMGTQNTLYVSTSHGIKSCRSLSACITKAKVAVGGAASPDRPNMDWQYIYFLIVMPGWHSNVAGAREASEKYLML